MKYEETNIKLNTKLNDGIEAIRKISMSTEEKQKIFQNILNSPIFFSPIRSPYMPFVIHSTFSILQKNLLFFYRSISGIIVVLGNEVKDILNVFEDGDRKR